MMYFMTTKHLHVSDNICIVHGTIIGAPLCKFADVYVKVDMKKYNLFTVRYSTITYINDQLYGKLSTLRPSDVQHLSANERAVKVRNHYAKTKRISDRILERNNLNAGI